MKTTLFTLCCGLFLAASILADEGYQAALDVVKPRVPDKLCRVTLNQRELGGELDRHIRNLVYSNYMVIDLDGGWLNHFRNRTDRGDQSHVYYGIGKVFDAGSLFAAYTGDPKVAARTQYIIDELVKSRDADGYLGFWKVEPQNRQDHINWILHEQEYINLALVRNYRCTGNPQSLAHAKIMGDYILKTFPTPQNPCYDAGDICTAGLPEGMLELYRVTGDKRYFDFAADVLRWMDNLLRLEGDLRYGELLERTICNSLFAANSPDGRWIRYFTPFTADRQYDSRNHAVRMCLLQVDDLLALARRTAGRNLSTKEWQTVMPGEPYFEVFPGLPIPED